MNSLLGLRKYYCKPGILPVWCFKTEQIHSDKFCQEGKTTGKHFFFKNKLFLSLEYRLDKIWARHFPFCINAETWSTAQTAEEPVKTGSRMHRSCQERRLSAISLRLERMQKISYQGLSDVFKPKTGSQRVHQNILSDECSGREEISKWKYHIVSNLLAPKILTYRSRASSPRARTKPLVSICPNLSTYSGRPSEEEQQYLYITLIFTATDNLSKLVLW